MTAFEFLESKGIWFNGTYEDGVVKHHFIAELMQEYHDSEVKNLNIPCVIKSVCECEKQIPNYPEMLWCNACGKWIK